MKYKLRERFYLGSKLPPKGPIRVIGGGIAGLLTGFFLQQRGYDFEIIERAERPGGLLGTQQLERGLAEQAANGFLWSPEVQALCDALKLPLLAPQPSAKKRFLVRGQKLHRFPLRFLESIVLLGRALWPHRQTLQTASDFGRVYFGDAFAQQVLSPGLAGIYGANADQLSFPGALSPVARMLNRSDFLPLAVWRHRRAQPKAPGGKRPVGTHGFAGGMADLIDALQERLHAHLRLGVDGLQYRDSTDYLILTTPAHVSQHFFSGPSPNGSPGLRTRRCSVPPSYWSARSCPASVKALVV
ncbi:MAG: NAD(P)-binding protein [Bacteroidota bacterium]